MRYDLSSLADAEITALQAEGIALTPRQIIRINNLAHHVETPQSNLALARGRPVYVGGAYLWPLTLAAIDWFQRIGSTLGGVKMQTRALAYAMAHGSDPLPESESESRRLITQWVRRLRCTADQLVEAVTQCNEQSEQIAEHSGPTPAPGEISAMCAAMTKTDPAIWEYQCSLPYVQAMLDCMVMQNDAAGQSVKNDARMRADKVLGMYVHKIRKRWKAKHAEA